MFNYSLAVKGRLIIIGYIGAYQSDKGYNPSRALSTLPARVSIMLEIYISCPFVPN